MARKGESGPKRRLARGSAGERRRPNDASTPVGRRPYHATRTPYPSHAPVRSRSLAAPRSASCVHVPSHVPKLVAQVFTKRPAAALTCVGWVQRARVRVKECPPRRVRCRESGATRSSGRGHTHETGETNLFRNDREGHSTDELGLSRPCDGCATSITIRRDRRDRDEIETR